MVSINEKIKGIIICYQSIIDIDDNDECYSLIADLNSLFTETIEDLEV